MTFFSVDVESSGTDPFKHDLLTVGAVALADDGLIEDYIYLRIDAPDAVWDEDTYDWWTQQNSEAKAELWSTSLPRYPALTVASALSQWVMMVGTSEVGSQENVFMANPATFDYMWIKKLFSTTGVDDPFGYRTMCLRSAAWGKTGATVANWSEHQRTHKPFTPHHALHDAQAQGLDFLELISK